MKHFRLLTSGFLMLMLLVSTVATAQWNVYQGDVLPEDNDPAFAVNDKTGATAPPTWTVADGELTFLSPGVTSDPDDRTAYRQIDLDTETKLTVVMRLKAADAATYGKVLEVDTRFGGFREKLVIDDSGEIEHQRGGVKAAVGTNGVNWDVNEYHIYRFVVDMEAQTATTYIDENETAVLTNAITEANTSKYWRIGDGSGSNTYGAVIDWIAWQYDAVTPAQAALPASVAGGSASDKKVVFITDDEYDAEQVAFLEEQGLSIETFWPGDLSTAGQDTIDYLNSADLIIIGRSPGSGTFDDPDKTFWNALTAPILSNNQYGSRSNRINWFNSETAFHWNEGPNPWNTFVNVSDDPIFQHVDLTAEDSLDMYMPAHDFIAIPDTILSAMNGTIVASGDALKDNAGDKIPVATIVRFDAGVEFYTGSVDMPAGPRTYFGFGNDNATDGAGEKIYNYFPLTNNAKHVYVAEILRMLDLPIVPAVITPKSKKVVFISDDDRDAEQIAFLERNHFNIETFWPGDLSTAGQDTIDYLNSADLIIIGRSPGSGTFDDPDKTFWNALTPPILSNNQYGSRSNRINWFNSETAFHWNEGPSPWNTHVSINDDPIFQHVTLTAEDSLDMYNAAHDFLAIPDTILSAMNGTIVASGDALKDNAGDKIPVATIVRFDAGVEFYTGSVDMPAGPRTYFGFGNDNATDGAGEKIYNYFPLTDNAKHVYVAELLRMLDLPIAPAVIAAEDREVIFITDDEKDDEQIEFLTGQGFNVTKFWFNEGSSMSTVPQDTIDMLNAADLLIIGRSPGSANFETPDKEVWNALTPPMISNNQYGSRSNRINWFNSTSAFHANEGPNPFNAFVEDNTDEIFQYVTLTAEDSLDLFTPPHDFLSISAGTQTNAEIVASHDSIVVIARFDAGVEFYTGSVDMPAGPRTYFGFGNDNTGVDHYFPLTDNAKQVYVNELQRMLDLPLTKLREASAVAGTILFVHDASNIDESNGGSDPRDKPFIDKLVSEGYTVVEQLDDNLSFLTDEELAAYNEADLVIAGRSVNSGAFGGNDKKAWNRVTAPLMLMSPFGARSSRINWFPSTDAPSGGLGAADIAGDSVTVAKVLDGADAAFDGIDVSSGEIDFFVGPYRTLFMTDDQYDSSAATHLVVIEASANNNANATDDALIMARFDVGVEFYTGAGDSAAAPRTYFGLGNDDTTYYNLSSDAEQVWLNEVANLITMEYEALDFASPNAGLATLTSDGIEVFEFDPAKTEYNVELAAGSSVPVTAAETIDPNAADPVITQADAIPGTATVVVTAEDGVTEMTYTVNYSETSDEQTILFIGDDTEATAGLPDDAIIAKIEALGYGITYMNDDDFTAFPPDFNRHNMIFFSESMSSQASATFVDAGYPLPALIMEPFAVVSTSGRMAIGEVVRPDGGDGTPTTQLKVTNTSHFVTNGFWEPNEVVTMTTAPHLQQGVDILPELDPIELAEIEGYPGITPWVLIEPAGVLNERTAVFGMFDGSALDATEDYWLMLERTVLWVLDDFGVSEPFNSFDLTSGVSVYPNPTQDFINVEVNLEKEGQLAISVMNVNGQLVKAVETSFRTSGLNKINLDLNGLHKGMYFVKVEGAGISQVAKVFIGK